MTKHEYYIEEKDKVTKIKITIDYQVKSFKKLFFKCKCVESINFKKFYRNNITDMSFDVLLLFINKRIKYY